MKKPIILGVGELLWDLLPDGPQLGGAPANFAYHAHRLGAEAYIVSALGADAYGKQALELLQEVGLRTKHIGLLGEYPTGTVTVRVSETGQPAYTIVEDVAWDYVGLTPGLAELASEAEAVCFGSLAQRAAGSRAAIGSLLGLTRPECLRVFDINLRAPFYEAEVVRHSLSMASALKLNDEELPILAELLECEAEEGAFFRHLLVDHGLQFVALTRGAHGATLVTPRERLDLPAQPPAQLVDTVGAGDAFTAALVTGWLARKPMREIGERAIRLASFVCSQKGAMPVYDRIP